ncbi:MAG: class I SAM-dependent methyltransferase [Thermoplasmatota archaeon]
MNIPGDERVKRHYMKLAVKILRLYLGSGERTEDLVRRSYDEIAVTYDDLWTNHMRDRSRDMLDRLNPENGQRSIDLTCGTGYFTSILASRTRGETIGVDSSPGMLRIAEEKYGNSCRFVRSDIVEYLKGLPADSADIVTCAWGLGYSRPFKVIREAGRVVRPGGKIGIIDNTIFSIREAVVSSLITAAERPEYMKHMVKVRFLPTLGSLKRRMVLGGFTVSDSWSGSKTYDVVNGWEALYKLKGTGALAGIEHSTFEESRDEIADIFVRNIESMYLKNGSIGITHRYIGAVGRRR